MSTNSNELINFEEPSDATHNFKEFCILSNASTIENKEKCISISVLNT